MKPADEYADRYYKSDDCSKNFVQLIIEARNEVLNQFAQIDFSHPDAEDEVLKWVAILREQNK
jgi:hypothetical protein